MSSSIKDKTVRPGSLSGYSYYRSNRKSSKKVAKKPAAEKKSRTKLIVISLLIIFAGYWIGIRNDDTPKPAKSAAVSSAAAPSVTEAVGANNCEGNQLDKMIKISVDKRKLWACQKDKSVYSVFVITGLRGHAETETPVGIYKIYGKTKDTTLTGSDSRGAWRDPVYYWMPFLDNQYGTYGFHDATWRSNSEFGKVSPDSEDASHGCVELPLTASKWLYDWAPIGTTVAVES